MIKKFFRDHPIHKKLVVYLDLFILLQPINYFLIWVSLSVGMYLGLFLMGQSPQFITDFEYEVLFLFLGISFIMSSSYIDNQLHLNKNYSSIDFIKDKYSLKAINEIKKYLNILGLLVLFFSFWVNFLLGLFLFFINTLIQRYEFKINFLLQLFSQLAILFIISMMGFLYTIKEFSFISYTLQYLLLLIPYLLLYIAAFIVAYSKDEGTNIRTSKFIYFIAFLLIFSGIVLSYIFNEPLASISLFVSSPFFIYVLARGLDKDFQRVRTYPIAILNLFCMTIYPYLFIASFAIFYINKYYNWHRFDYHFPTFLVEND
tara:strand:- start:111 stop:1058 length:948 start_codon:yes stop_codon:yes gene_type:complete